MGQCATVFKSASWNDTQCGRHLNTCERCAAGKSTLTYLFAGRAYGNALKTFAGIKTMIRYGLDTREFHKLYPVVTSLITFKLKASALFLNKSKTFPAVALEFGGESGEKSAVGSTYIPGI